jgi:hypothetical protein
MKSIIVKALALLTGASRSVLEFILPILKKQREQAVGRPVARCP